MALADVVHEETIPCSFQYSHQYFKEIDKRINHLIIKCVNELRKQGFKDEDISAEIYLNMRYEKTDFPVMTRIDSLSKDSQYFVVKITLSNHFFKLTKESLDSLYLNVILWSTTSECEVSALTMTSN